jgi:phage shock protein PspC (stress-responsive transcriptional regulator)
MNKVFNINLGGYPFTIDENAYHHLKQYLSAIDSHFKNSDGFDDITTDIEARLAEIFSETLQGRQIVMLKDVQGAINIMGTPEDFGAESNYSAIPEEEKEEASEETNEGIFKKKMQRFGKRMYRNPEETVVGGVASGVSAYFGIEEPLWIRIAFVLFIVGGGFGIPLYVILWAVLPEAKTAKQKLEMRGEKIDVNSIAKTIEEEVTHIKDRFQEFGDEFKSSKKNRKKKRENNEDETSYGSSSVDQGIAFVRQSAGAFERFVRTISKSLLYIIGVILMVIVGIFWVALIMGSVMGFDYTRFMVGESQAPFVNALVFLAIGLPIISTAISIVRIFFRTKIHKSWRIGLTLATVAAVSGLFYFGTQTAKDFEVKQTQTNSINLGAVSTEKISLTANYMDYQSGFMRFNGTKIIDDRLYYDNHVRLEFQAAEGNLFELSKEVSAHGKNEKTALSRIKKLDYPILFENGTLDLQAFIKVEKDKFRAQGVDLVLAVPVGKSIVIEEPLLPLLSYRLEVKDGYFHKKELIGKTLQMTDEGFVCEDCKDQPRQSKNGKLDFQNFSDVRLTGNMKVYFVQGENYAVKVDNEHTHVRTRHNFIRQSDSLLTVEGPGEDSRPLKVYITMPNLSALTANNVGDVWLTNFDVAYLKMEVRGKSDIHVEGLKANKLEINAYNEAEVTLDGSGSHLIANFYGDSDLDADRFEVNVANVLGFDDADMKVNVLDTLYQKTSGDADIDHEGAPVMMPEE